MRPIHPLRWLGDWRNGLVLCVSVALAFFGHAYLDGVHSRHDLTKLAHEALAARDSTAKASVRRIDALTRQADANTAAIISLREQLVVHGIMPESSVAPAAPPTTVARHRTRSGTTTTAPKRSTTTTTGPTTTTTTPCRVRLGSTCVTTPGRT